MSDLLTRGLDGRSERWCLAACAALCTGYIGILLTLQVLSVRFDAIFLAKRERIAERRLPELLQHRLPAGRLVQVSNKGALAPSLLLLRGWSSVEDWGVWTDGSEAEFAIALPAGASPPAALQIETKIMLVPKRHQRINFTAAGYPLGTWQFAQKRPGGDDALLCLPLPPESVTAGGIVRIAIDIGAPQHPLGGADDRNLGLALESLQVLPGPEACDPKAVPPS